MTDVPHILMLSGSVSPLAPDLVGHYNLLKQLAGGLGIALRILIYPGQERSGSGDLSYRTALEAAKAACAQKSPDAIVGLSLGCVVCSGLFDETPQLVRNCRRVVLWGAYTDATLAKNWGSVGAQRACARLHRLKWSTRFADNYFAVHPSSDALIKKIACDMHLVRGTGDELNTLSELNGWAAMHAAAQPQCSRQVVEIAGLGHPPRIPFDDATVQKRVSEALFSGFVSAGVLAET